MYWSSVEPFSRFFPLIKYPIIYCHQYGNMLLLSPQVQSQEWKFVNRAGVFRCTAKGRGIDIKSTVAKKTLLVTFLSVWFALTSLISGGGINFLRSFIRGFIKTMGFLAWFLWVGNVSLGISHYCVVWNQSYSYMIKAFRSWIDKGMTLFSSTTFLIRKHPSHNKYIIFIFWMGTSFVIYI